MIIHVATLFQRAMAICPIVVLCLLLPPAGIAQQSTDDLPYELITPPLPTSSPEQIEVIDVFWYGCPHCYSFLPLIEAYERDKPPYVAFRHLPVVLRKSWETHAKIFYTAQALGVADKLHPIVFNAIHVDANTLSARQDIEALFVRNGVGKKDFNRVYSSFAVLTELRRSHEAQEAYGVLGTPAVIVNGRYRITASKAGGHEQMIEVIKALVAKERRAGR